MTFVANPPASAPGPDDTVAGDGWWPDLSIAAYRAEMRVGTVVTDARARRALIGGMLSAEADLSAWRTARKAEGIAALAQVEPARTIGDEPRAVALWRRAVHAYATADLVETHGEISATSDGRARLEERASSATDHLRAATLAVRDLLGRRRSRVALL